MMNRKLPENLLISRIFFQENLEVKFLSLTELQKFHNLINEDDINVDKILSKRSNLERIFYILIDQDILKDADLTNFIKTVNKEGIVSILKKLGAYITINQSNFCIPAMWILIAVEMDPKTYSNVIEWFLTETDVLDDVGTLF